MDKTANYNIIGHKIRILREARGISQDRLSKLADLSLNTIVKVESGKNPNPTIKTLSKIAKSFRVKVDDLIAVLLIFLLLSFSSYGRCSENNPPGPVVLSLEGAITVAFKNNKDIQIQEKEIAV